MSNPSADATNHGAAPPRAATPSICFVAPGAYAALSGRADIAQIGGAEIQQTLVARELVRRGYRVRFVTRDHGQPDGIEHDGINAFKMCGRDAGLPGVRFIHPRWTSLVAALRRANTDVYYQRAAGVETGQVARWCQSNGRAFVFAAAVDDDCMKSLPLLGHDLRAKWLYRYGLRHADAIVAQTQTQVSLLRSSFGVEATLIRSCSVDPMNGAADTNAAADRTPPTLLWVGRLAEQKRPDRLLDLAAALPDVRFEMVGAANTRSRYAAGIQQRADGLDNVKMTGWTPHAAMAGHYDRATLLVCTSDSEGYPNTFMEAWARGVPTVSTVDPDGVVAGNGLGAIGKDVPALAEQIRSLLQDKDARRRCSQQARRFFQDHHTVRSCVDAYERILDGLVPGGRVPGSGHAPLSRRG